MRIFVTGATGYIGGSLAARLVASGHQVFGLVRQEDKATQLRARGIEPVLGSLADLTTITDAARQVDAVVNTANSDDWFVANAIVEALAGSGKRFIHTSGSSVVADRAAGERSDCVFSEDTPFEPLPERMLRVAVDRTVLLAAQRNVASVVIRPTLIYGRGHGLNPHSMQIPHLIELAQKFRIAHHVGRGLNIWSHVHIDDVVTLYMLALAKAPPGSLFYAENGESSWKDMASAIGRTLGFGATTKDWPVEDALRAWGSSAITSYGSNSRVSAAKARMMLGWKPAGPALTEEIEHGCYAGDFAHG
ncbi:NAD-dependent epimerase/dehydratase family protein [Bradyrhizobium sp. NP1]|uniref:NAD-dependent epimerase/dehydratase family protein n=1 Tax=Bradyrhizobium sp. NP1 TaxID=3049772 RepID=UPI0025A5E47D|nr:NAD-dependent epimerase/dehydratase family protein [Bradyrhizobium sp. NP1]WJR76616.1 NAD-dependent epimerase/dehydratase family protein [Bradyrhizobium sp. NP1]